VFHFEIMDEVDTKTSKWNQEELNLLKLKEIIDKWYRILKEQGWNSVYLNNHDRPRMVSRFGDDSNYRRKSAKMLATFNMTLPGTPYIYQGEELGMTNIKFKSIDNYRDIETLNYYQEQRERGIDKEQIMEQIYWASRDNARTPVQWNNSKNAGFTNGRPWIEVNPNYHKINAAAEKKDPESVLNYYKKILKLRNDEKNQALIYGEYIPLAEDNPNIYSYFREYENDRLLIILNFTGEQIVYDFIEREKIDNEKLLLSNYNIDNSQENDILSLYPYEARVYRV
ncbi:MAG: alpha-amylase family glycosyl hydrolase, partial [Halothermotrichaceae bacterium]